MNHMRTYILLAGMTALFGVVGLLLGGQNGMLIALVVAAGMNLFSYWNSDKLALRAHNAQEVDETTAPELVAMVRSWPSARRCRCRASTSSTRSSPTPSRQGETPKTPRSPPRPASCSC